MKALARKIIRSKTNDGQLAKQIVYLCGRSDKELCIVIHKLVLTDLPDYRTHMKLEKTYKGKNLYSSVFPLKIDTLRVITNWLNELS